MEDYKEVPYIIFDDLCIHNKEIIPTQTHKYRLEFDRVFISENKEQNIVNVRGYINFDGDNTLYETIALRLPDKQAYEQLALSIPVDQIKNSGVEIFPLVFDDLRNHQNILKLLEEREKYGITKYGQTLMSNDGRDDMTEIINEYLDAIVYMRKYIHNHNNITMKTLYHLTIEIVSAILESRNK